MQLNAKTTALVLVTPQSMGGTLAAMEEEGLVERQPDIIRPFGNL
jgi:DNA-binding MarR family transcriptional regulator